MAENSTGSTPPFQHQVVDGGEIAKDPARWKDYEWDILTK